MCHLNILLQKKNSVNKLGFLMSVTSNSYATNSDGDGINFKDIVYKKKTKLNLMKYETQINEEKNILTHQRIATSGFKKKFLQPFINEDFVLMHNGVISSYAKHNKSDTYNLFEKINKEFKKLKSPNREKNITKVIQNIFDNLSGSFSIILKDIVTGKIYYFKNSNSTIKVYRSKNTLYMTTSSSNEIFLSLLGENFKEIDIDDNTIYLLNVDELKYMGKLKKCPVVVYNPRRSYSSMTYDPTISEKKDTFKLEETLEQQEERNLEIIENYLGELQTATTGKCYQCKKNTIYHNNLYDTPHCLECYDTALEDIENYLLTTNEI